MRPRKYTDQQRENILQRAAVGETYDGREDAERILEQTLSRRNWTPDLRDALQVELEKLVWKYGR